MLIWVFAVSLGATPSARAVDRSLDVGVPRGTASRVDPARPPQRTIPDAWIEQIYLPGRGLVWFTAEGPRAATQAGLRSLRDAGERGLAPDDYNVGALEREIEALRRSRPQPEAVDRVDKAMTATMLRFLSDLRFGRIRPQEIEPHYRAQPKDANFVAQLRDAVAQDSLLALIDEAEPVFPIYRRLKHLLARYRALAAEPRVVLPPPPPRTRIAPGDRYSGAGDLRELLVRLGDLDPSSPPATSTYTDELADAVRRFQARHGLQADGILGSHTLAALNTSIAERVTQVVLSLERLRWLPDLPPGPLIAINIPSFRLWAFADASDMERATLTMPIVVGKAMRTETPVFLAEMRSVEFSPYWNVPPSILRDELLPRLAGDPGYLEREDMEVVATGRSGHPYAAIDAASLAALRSGEARLRQRPGPRNALGGVKFVLPNAMDIYLHATPARELFGRVRRDFSHGCIRVGEPEALARFVLRARPEWTPEQIESAMRSRVNRTVQLPVPVPVVIYYTTVLVDADGHALFLPDIYGHDRELRDALARASRGAG